MKKKLMQKIVSAGLIFTMVLGLTACGNKGEDSSGGGAGKKDANAMLAKEGVFAEQPLEMPESGDDFGVNMLSYVNDRIYALIEVYNWSKGGESELKLFSWKDDGSDAQTIELQMSLNGEEDTEGTENEAEAETENEAETETEAETEAESNEDAPAVEDLDGDMIMDDMAVMMPEGGYEYTYLSNGTIASDGKLYAIKEYYKEDYSDPENIVNINETSVCCWTLDGVMQWEMLIEDLHSEEAWSYIQSLLLLKDGRLAVIIGGDKQEKLIVGTDGSIQQRQPMPESASILANASNIFPKGDGTYSVVYWEETENYCMKVASYDAETDTVGEGAKLPDSLMMSGYNGLTVGMGADLLYSNSTGVFAYTIGEEEAKPILNFINSDMTTSSMYNMYAMDDTRLVAFYHDSFDGKTKGGIFTKVNPEDIPDKSVLVIAGNYVDYNMKKRVVDFNKSSQEYRMVIKEYQQYSTMEDYMAGYTRLNNDIISGGMPDILIGDTNMSMENYISKGLLADVGELIKQDEELSQKAFMENVFNAYKVKDKLYYVIPYFNIRTMLAKKAFVGDRTGWTMQEMQEIVKSMPEGAQAIGDLTQSDFFYTMMQFCGSDFVDVSTGKCNFDSTDFIAMLEYAKELPTEFGEEYWGEEYWMNYQSQYRDNKTLMMSAYIGSARDMVRNINGYFGEEVNYIGFPTESGKGSVIIADQYYALSAKSQNLEGAWEFIRYYLQDEYQNELEWALPVSKDVFVAKAKDATQNPYYLDENGEKVEYEDTFYINEEEIPLPNLSQEQLDTFISFVEGVDKKSYYNEAVMNIINEEAAAFFEGQKSAQDVAGIIQSRVQIYVNENR